MILIKIQSWLRKDNIKEKCLKNIVIVILQENNLNSKAILQENSLKYNRKIS